MDLAAMENGTNGEEVAAAFAKMNRSMQEAVEGGKSQAEAFDKLNLSAEYLKTLAPEKRFELIARAVIGAKARTGSRPPMKASTRLGVRLTP